MKTLRSLFLLLLILALLGVTSVVAAQVSTNAYLSWNVLSGGGGSRSSTNHQLYDVVGQTASTQSQSLNAFVQSGFLAGFQSIKPIESKIEVFLPVLLR